MADLNVMFNNLTTVMLSGPVNVTITVPGGPGGPVSPVSPFKEKTIIEQIISSVFLLLQITTAITSDIVKILLSLHSAINPFNTSLCLCLLFILQ